MLLTALASALAPALARRAVFFCFAQEITEFLSGEDLLRVKPFIGQGNSGGAKARAAAEAAKSSASNRHDGNGGRGGGAGEVGGGGEGGADDALAPKERLKGQTQKEQKVGVLQFYTQSFFYSGRGVFFFALGVWYVGVRIFIGRGALPALWCFMF